MGEVESVASETSEFSTLDIDHSEANAASCFDNYSNLVVICSLLMPKSSDPVF